MKAKYVNPFTDFGFKKIFGEEASKPLLIDFLGCLLPEANIVDLSFKDKEKQGQAQNDRKAVYDIYCESGTGEKFIVEVQKAEQNYFIDRTIYYATFPINKSFHFPSPSGEGAQGADEAEQAPKGYWDFKLKAVYCVGVLGFTFEEKSKLGRGDVVRTVQLKDHKNKLFYEKLKFVYLEMPHFVKTENELETRLDKWLYFIKHLEDFEAIPEIFKDAVFTLAFEKAEIAKYTTEELHNYEQSLKVYRDLKNVIDTAFEEGLTEGEMKGEIKGEIKAKKEVVKALKQSCVPIEIIINAAGLTESEIEEL